MFLLTFDSRLLCLLNNALCAGMLPELLIQLIDESTSAKIIRITFRKCVALTQDELKSDKTKTPP